MPIAPNDPSSVNPPPGRFTEAEMAKWPQHVGVRRVVQGNQYEDQFMLVRSLHHADAVAHFERHGFRYRGRLGFNVPFERSPPWLINLSLALGRFRLRRERSHTYIGPITYGWLAGLQSYRHSS
jgi:hypothetical protein